VGTTHGACEDCFGTSGEIATLCKKKKKKTKCSFGKQEVQYLGHVISPEGMRVDFGMVEAMKKWPKLETLKAMHGFLGLTGYYKRFIQANGKIAVPLNRMC
jgi:hypothetical protein